MQGGNGRTTCGGNILEGSLETGAVNARPGLPAGAGAGQALPSPRFLRKPAGAGGVG